MHLRSVLPGLLAASRPATALLPSDDAARANAFAVFNAVHSAMRQWGASLHHNGVSAFVATVPEGQLFYHGGMEPDRPAGINGTGCEWLAFEVEHARIFAMPFDGLPPPSHRDPPSEPPSGPPLRDADWTQKPLGTEDQADHGNNDNSDIRDRRPKHPRHPPDSSQPTRRGYFHTYRANRPLNLLYLDGMSAGNSYYGTMDFQDGVLLDWPLDGSCIMKERARAMDLCRVADEWAWDGGKIDGFVRTEAGFEIIYCDFSEGGGLDVASIHASPFANETVGRLAFPGAEFMRSVTHRYHGMPVGRIHVDWSSMVSAFFYDVNLTNPDASRPELPRLASTTRDERQDIRARLHEVVVARAGRQSSSNPAAAAAAGPIDWQGIVDLVVTRLSARLWQLAQGASPVDTARRVVCAVLDPFLTYPADAKIDYSTEAIDRCAQHYLSAAVVRRSSWTPEDGALYAAIETVTQTICSSLFDLRNVLLEGAAKDADDDSTLADAVRSIAVDLMATLQWTTWKECDPCADPDEVCLVAMFPWGSSDDHFHPRCVRAEETAGHHGYWLGNHGHIPIKPPG